MAQKLTIEGILKEGITIGLQNAAAIVVNFLLWILTIWIPYLNVGTTIGMLVGITAKASKGEAIGMTEIFNPAYRKRMGEYFIGTGLMGMGTMSAAVFFLAPAIVLSFAWSQASLLIVDKEMNPSEAIDISGKITYGNKATMFLAQLILIIAIGVVGVIFSLIPFLGPIIAAALMVCSFFIVIGMNAYIYKTLTSDL